MKPLFLIALALAMALPAAGQGSGVVISEFMADNRSTLQDADGDYPDWIELFNASSNTLNLAGWHLTDTPTNLTRWTFPATELAPGAYLVVFASGKSRAVPGRELHASFQLDAGGEYLALVSPDGANIVFDVRFPAQFADTAFALPMSEFQPEPPRPPSPAGHAIRGIDQFPAPGGVNRNRGDTQAAIDRLLSTFSYLTTSFTDRSHGRQRVALNLAAPLPVNRLRMNKLGDVDGTGSGEGFLIDPVDLRILYSVDAPTNALRNRAYLPVSGLTSGYNGTELIHATLVNPDGSVLADRHDSAPDDSGYFSLTFDTISNATALAVEFFPSASDNNGFNHYAVREFQVHHSADAATGGTGPRLTAGHDQFPAPGGVTRRGDDTALALDGDTNTSSFLSLSGTTFSAHGRQRFALDLGEPASVNRLRVNKHTDAAGLGRATPVDLTLLFTTNTGPLAARDYAPVSQLVNGFIGVEPINAASVSGNGTIEGDVHEGAFSLTFAPVTATAIALEFRPSPGGGNDANRYRVREIEARYDPEPASASPASLTLTRVTDTSFRHVEWPSPGGVNTSRNRGPAPRGQADSVVVFNELMYRPADGDAARQWIELYNQMGADVDLSDWTIEGGVYFQFPRGALVRGGRYLVVAAQPGLVAGALGPWQGNLARRDEPLVLRNNNGRIMDCVDFRARPPWPVGPDTTGFTLAKRSPETPGGDAVFWTHSAQPGGTPGQTNFPSGVAAPGVRFNEASAASAAPFWVELINESAQPVDLAGYVLALGEASAAEFVLAPSALAPGAHQVLDAGQLGFAPTNGQKLFLFAPTRTALLDAIVIDETLRGRSPRHAGQWLFPDAPTPGQPNSFTFHEDIVINEILYHHPPSYETPAVEESIPMLPVDALWRFDQSGVDFSNAWRQVAFDDRGWSSGQGVFFVTAAALPAPKNTPLTLGRRTYYFRTTIMFDGDPSVSGLDLRPLIDDGAVFYVNGVEVGRVNMPGGPVTHDTLAPVTVGNAAFGAPVRVPRTRLTAGQNLLAVEVHQSSVSSSDIVFGLEVAAVRQLSPPTAYRENPEEWIELFNRGAQAVDLSGWRFADGIDFTFAPGTILPAGGYLVVANDTAALRARDPAIALVGDFQGQLANGGERLLLTDAAGNPADEVHYDTHGRWPTQADGGGSSLELLDPFADNAVAEAWAPSDEGAKSAWQTVRYRGFAGPDTGLTTWREFVVGLLDAGEALLDDIFVYEDPRGTNRAILQNSTFETNGLARWRILGNHRGTVIDDPDQPGNRVWRLVATGATDDMHNHAETTLVANRPVVNGAEYEVSFRAKWLSGSPRLNTRLYFNKVSRSTVLSMPAEHGTPGRRNSRWSPNAGPTFTEFRHEPPVPNAGQAVSVRARASDPQGVAAVTLWFSVNGGAWLSTAMTAQPDGTRLGTIPGQSASAVVQFYLEGADGLSARAEFPPAGRGSRALYKVNDGLARGGPAHDFRIVMTAADYGFLLRDTNLMSNQRLGATIIYREREIFYDCGLRLKGTPFGRPQSEAVSFNIEFPAGQKFRGVHDGVVVDRSGLSPIGRGSQDEIITKHLLNASGGLPGMYDDIIRVIAPQTQHTGGALLLMARFGDVFLGSQFEDGDEGYTYKLEVVHTLAQTVDGTPEGLKRTVPDFMRTDIQDLGDSKENYRWNFQIGNHRIRDHFDELIPFAKAFSLSGAALSNALPAVMDADEWLRLFALKSLIGVSDTYTYGSPHNLQLYVRPSDHRVLALPWDLDGNFSQGTSAPLWSQENWNLKKVIELPHHARLFHAHLLHLIETTYNTAYLNSWIDHYAALAGEDYSSIKNYVTARGNFVRAALPARAPFQVATNSSETVSSNGASVIIRGTGGFDVRRVEVAGNPFPLNVQWSSASNWFVVVAVPPGPSVLNFRAFDAHDNLVGSGSLAVTNPITSGAVGAQLRLTELMYHPADPPPGSVFPDDDFEFIELRNLGTTPLNLAGVAFTDAVAFTFPNGLVALAPGAFAVLVKNRFAFASRYDTAGVFLAGEYAGNLSNGGERLAWRDADGNVVQDLVFNDAWHPATDGAGFSLTHVDPFAASATWTNAADWKPSLAVGGSPGREDDGTLVMRDDDRDGLPDEWELTFGLNPTLPDGAADLDGDGFSNREEFLARTNPNDARSALRWIRARLAGANLELQFPAVAHQSYQVQFSDSLATGSWANLAVVPSQPSDRLETLLAPAAPGAQRFYRIVVQPQQ